MTLAAYTRQIIEELEATGRYVHPIPHFYGAHNGRTHSETIQLWRSRVGGAARAAGLKVATRGYHDRLEAYVVEEFTVTRRNGETPTLRFERGRRICPVCHGAGYWDSCFDCGNNGHVNQDLHVALLANEVEGQAPYLLPPDPDPDLEAILAEEEALETALVKGGCDIHQSTGDCRPCSGWKPHEELTWRDATPTEPGLYVMCGKQNSNLPTLFHMAESQLKLWQGSPNYWWFGPIPEPSGVTRYHVELEDGEDNLRFLANALHQTFGEDYVLLTEDGRRVRYDSWADDGHHPGHDAPLEVEKTPVDPEAVWRTEPPDVVGTYIARRDGAWELTRITEDMLTKYVTWKPRFSAWFGPIPSSPR